VKGSLSDPATQSPAFGKATLENCEREQIHLPGSIQPHGCMLVIRASDLEVVQVSENAAQFLHTEAAVPGSHLEQIDNQLAWEVESLLGGSRKVAHKLPRFVQLKLGGSDHFFDIAIHQPDTAGIILEFELAQEDLDIAPFIEKSFHSILSTLTLSDLYEDSARLFKELTGYDRVMLYRFDQEGHGQVIAERRNSGLESFLGNFYPSTDIPQIARRLYEFNRVRMLADVDYEAVPLSPQLSPITHDELDMSMSQLRSVSPIHLQYLRNMGVSATMVVSLMVGGKLWGLVSCHHYSPRFVSLEVRTTAVLLVEMMATRIAALEGYAKAEIEVSLRMLEKRIIEAIARDGDWTNALFSRSRELLKVVNATSAALCFEGDVYTSGDVPGTGDIKAFVRWLDENAPDRLFSSSSLSLDIPGFESFRSVASGVISMPVSSSGSEYLLWFRHERRRTVAWGGNPNEHEVDVDHPEQLSPRRSFAKWYQLVEGTADAWTGTELTAAKWIGQSIEDMVYQFRAVRVLIAQEQMAHLTSDVRGAKQPVVVADSSGALLLVNNAFYQLLSEDHAELRTIYDLALVFKNREKIRDMLDILVRDQHTGRTEVEITNADKELRTLLLRADPVFADMGRVLGYVLFFADISDRKKIEQGKKKFQQSIVALAGDNKSVPSNRKDVLYHNLLSSAVNNAKLAAMEIGDDMDFDAVPQMLDSIKDSVSTTSELLRQLLARDSDSD
jgi:PAS domain S-box-containing protein